MSLYNNGDINTLYLQRDAQEKQHSQNYNCNRFWALVIRSFDYQLQKLKKIIN